MHTLYLLRHAKSSWDEPGLRDRERPLAPRGRRDAKRIAKHLVEHGVEPELVLCSDAKRTRETLELLRRALESATVEIEDGLYGASADELLGRIRLVPDSVASVLLIGHNPGIQDLALTIGSGGKELERLEAKFPTAALATFSLQEWSRLSRASAVLEAFVVPKQLR
jgi:phosphohistidine phosphatase